MALNYGYSSSRDSTGKTTYTDRSGRKVSEKEAKASGGRKLSKGVIGGKVYEDVTQKEILENKIDPYRVTQPKELKAETEARQKIVESNRVAKELNQRLAESRPLTQEQKTLILTGQSKISNINELNQTLANLDAKQTQKTISQIQTYQNESSAYQRQLAQQRRQEFAQKQEITQQPETKIYSTIGIDKRTEAQKNDDFFKESIRRGVEKVKGFFGKFEANFESGNKAYQEDINKAQQNLLKGNESFISPKGIVKGVARGGLEVAEYGLELTKVAEDVAGFGLKATYQPITQGKKVVKGVKTGIEFGMGVGVALVTEPKNLFTYGVKEPFKKGVSYVIEDPYTAVGRIGSELFINIPAIKGVKQNKISNILDTSKSTEKIFVETVESRTKKQINSFDVTRNLETVEKQLQKNIKVQKVGKNFFEETIITPIGKVIQKGEKIIGGKKYSYVNIFDEGKTKTIVYDYKPRSTKKYPTLAKRKIFEKEFETSKLKDSDIFPKQLLETKEKTLAQAIDKIGESARTTRGIAEEKLFFRNRNVEIQARESFSADVFQKVEPKGYGKEQISTVGEYKRNVFDLGGEDLEIKPILKEIKGGAVGYYSQKTGKVYIQKDLAKLPDNEEYFKTLVHEIAHQRDINLNKTFGKNSEYAVQDIAKKFTEKSGKKVSTTKIRKWLEELDYTRPDFNNEAFARYAEYNLKETKKFIKNPKNITEEYLSRGFGGKLKLNPETKSVTIFNVKYARPSKIQLNPKSQELFEVKTILTEGEEQLQKDILLGKASSPELTRSVLYPEIRSTIVSDIGYKAEINLKKVKLFDRLFPKNIVKPKKVILNTKKQDIFSFKPQTNQEIKNLVAKSNKQSSALVQETAQNIQKVKAVSIGKVARPNLKGLKQISLSKSKAIFKPITIQTTTQTTQLTNLVSPKQDVKSLFDFKPILDIREEQILRTSPDLDISPDRDIFRIQAQDQVTKPITQQIQRLQTETPNRPIFFTGGFGRFKAPKVPIIPIIPPLLKLRSNKEQGYNVQVRTKKKWYTLNKKPLNKVNAIDYGTDIVDKSSEASVRLFKSKKPVSATYSGINNNFKFRTKGNLLIEKRKYRIDTQGEFNKITAKGIAKNTKIF